MSCTKCHATRYTSIYSTLTIGPKYLKSSIGIPIKVVFVYKSAQNWKLLFLWQKLGHHFHDTYTKIPLSNNWETYRRFTNSLIKTTTVSWWCIQDEWVWHTNAFFNVSCWIRSYSSQAYTYLCYFYSCFHRGIDGFLFIASLLFSRFRKVFVDFFPELYEGNLHGDAYEAYQTIAYCKDKEE